MYLFKKNKIYKLPQNSAYYIFRIFINKNKVIILNYNYLNLIYIEDDKSYIIIFAKIV